MQEGALCSVCMAQWTPSWSVQPLDAQEEDLAGSCPDLFGYASSPPPTSPIHISIINFYGQASAVTCFSLLFRLAPLCMLSRPLASLTRLPYSSTLRIMSASSKSATTSSSQGHHTLCRTVNASEVASSYTSEIKSAIQATLNSSSSAKRHKLVGFLCGKKDSPSVTYADWTRKACESVGIEYELRIIDTEQEESENNNKEGEEQASVGGAALGAADLETAILEANVDPSVDLFTHVMKVILITDSYAICDI